MIRGLAHCGAHAVLHVARLLLAVRDQTDVALQRQTDHDYDAEVVRVVGEHVVEAYDVTAVGLRHADDEEREVFRAPVFLSDMIQSGMLGGLEQIKPGFPIQFG